MSVMSTLGVIRQLQNRPLVLIWKIVSRLFLLLQIKQSLSDTDERVFLL